jgi:hypothetical protein
MGVCKTTADCPTLTNLANNSPCGPAANHQICLGGVCAFPTVFCAGANRAISATNVCCESRAASGTVSESFGARTACPAVSLSTSTSGTTPIACDDHSDCAIGELCCLSSNSSTSSVECRTEEACSVANSNVFEVCTAPGGAAIPPGSFCFVGDCAPASTGGFISGWTFCDNTLPL